MIWLDGKFVKDKDATVHIVNHGLHYGSSVFEGIRAYRTSSGPAVFRLNDHVDRFFASAAALDLKIPYSKTAIQNAIKKTIALNHLNECYIRPVAFYGEGQMTLMPKGAKVRVAIAVWPWPAYLGENKMLSVGVSKYIRFHPKSVVPGAKIGGYYATSVLATIDARKRGFNEAILLDHEGYISEGPGENIFMVKRGKLYTPKSPSILPGITRASVITIAKNMGIKVAEKKISLAEFMRADEAFFTGTAAEVAPIGIVNKKKIGDGRMGPVTLKIRETFLSAVHGKLPRYRKWIDKI